MENIHPVNLSKSGPPETILPNEDPSAIEALNKLAERYQKRGKTIHLRHLAPDCVKLIKRAEKICDVNILEDPDYFVAIDDYNKALERV